MKLTIKGINSWRGVFVPSCDRFLKQHSFTRSVWYMMKLAPLSFCVLACQELYIMMHAKCCNKTHLTVPSCDAKLPQKQTMLFCHSYITSGPLLDFAGNWTIDLKLTLSCNFQNMNVYTKSVISRSPYIKVNRKCSALLWKYYLNQYHSFL